LHKQFSLFNVIISIVTFKTKHYLEIEKLSVLFMIIVFVSGKIKISKKKCKNTAEERKKIEKDHCQHPGKQLPFNCKQIQLKR
jgi:hypothetical protein